MTDNLRKPIENTEQKFEQNVNEISRKFSLPKSKQSVRIIQKLISSHVTFNVITCIFILLVWYSYIISPYIDECKNQLKDEYRWEEERLFMQEKKALSVAGSVILQKLESKEE